MNDHSRYFQYVASVSQRDQIVLTVAGIVWIAFCIAWLAGYVDSRWQTRLGRVVSLTLLGVFYATQILVLVRLSPVN